MELLFSGKEFGATSLDGGEWMSLKSVTKRLIILKDIITDNFLQQILIGQETMT